VEVFSGSVKSQARSFLFSIGDECLDVRAEKTTAGESKVHFRVIARLNRELGLDSTDFFWKG